MAAPKAHQKSMVQRAPGKVEHPDLFGPGPEMPEGFSLRPELLGREEETQLAARFTGLDFKPFEFRGYTGKRRVVSFGWRYDFGDNELREVEGMPEWLAPIRDRAAGFAGLTPDELPHVLVTEYSPGAAIGWHRDRPDFEDVVGISLCSPCTFRFRRRAGLKWERASFIAQPRSAYLLRGPSRTDWEHSIPAVDALRYSITFRSLKAPPHVS